MAFIYRMNRFKIIAFTHSGIGLDGLSAFYWEKDGILLKAAALKKELQLTEIMYLSTCNRIEFLVATDNDNELDLLGFLTAFNPDFTEEEIESYSTQAKVWTGINAVNHLIEVASSLDSMVLGEREIISQVRDAFDFSFKNGLCGDLIRINIKQTIATAKRIYTETDIAKKPVSVVSLAFQSLIAKITDKNAGIVVVGSGRTNTNLIDFLQAFGFKNFSIFNRTFEHAEKLAAEIGGKAYSLKDLSNFKSGFDIMLCCTGSGDHIITEEIYSSILNKDRSKKFIVDLSIPGDLHPDLPLKFDIDHISLEFLKGESEANLQERRKELITVRQIIYDSLEEFKHLFRLRQMEIKMRSIPERVREIREKATKEVFSRELEELDDQSRETLEKILNYMEKKYVSVPMIMAKQFAEEEGES